MRTDLDQLISRLTRENLEIGQEIRHIQWDPNLTDTQKRHQVAVLGRQYRFNEDRIVELAEEKWNTSSKDYYSDTTCKAFADLMSGPCAGCPCRPNQSDDGCFIDGHGI